jgi:hypothetical protein
MSSSKVHDSPTYKIHRWDAVQFSTIKKFPMIYITPDLAFLEFAHNNNYQVIAQISGTQKIYDHQKMQGTVDKSGSIPNCRANYFEKTGYYVIILDATWEGYPTLEHLGEVSFVGLTLDKYNKQDLIPTHTPAHTPNQNDLPQLPPKHTPKQSINNSNKGMGGYEIAVVSSILVAAFLILIGIYFIRKK